MKGTWQTTDHGSGAGVLLAIGALLLLGSGGAVAAVSEALLGALIAVAVVTVLAVGGLVVFLAHHARHPAEIPSSRGIVPAPQRFELPGAERPAIGAPQQLHLHFHGVDATDVAEIIRQQKPPEQ